QTERRRRGLRLRTRFAWLLEAADGRGQCERLALADDLEGHRATHWSLGHHARQVARAGHRAAVVLDDDVALLETGLRRGRSLVDGGHERSLGAADVEALRELRGERLDADTEPAARHVAGGGQLADDGLGEVDGNRETNADRATAAAQDRGVDADDLAARVDERATAVARVDRRVGLDEVVVGAAANDAPGGAHDAGRHRLLEAERIANRHHGLADFQRRRVTERDGRQAVRIDLQERQVGARITADDAAGQLAAIRQLHANLRGAVDDVV